MEEEREQDTPGKGYSVQSVSERILSEDRREHYRRIAGRRALSLAAGDFGGKLHSE